MVIDFLTIPAGCAEAFPGCQSCFARRADPGWLPVFHQHLAGRIATRLEDQIVNPELQQAYKDRKAFTGDSLTRHQILAPLRLTDRAQGIMLSALRRVLADYLQHGMPRAKGGTVFIAGHRPPTARPSPTLTNSRR